MFHAFKGFTTAAARVGFVAMRAARAAPPRCVAASASAPWRGISSSIPTRQHGWGARAQAARRTAGAAGEKQQWVCSECGRAHVQWFGQCQGCRAFGALEEVRVAPASSAPAAGGGEGMSAARRTLQRAMDPGSAGAGAGAGAGAAAALNAVGLSAGRAAAAAAARVASVNVGTGGAGLAVDGDGDGPDYAALEAEADDGYDPAAPGLFEGGGGPRGGARSRRATASAAAAPSARVGGARGVWLASTAAAAAAAGPEALASIRRDAAAARLALPGDTGAEVARVLGGGLVPGSLVLVGGDPGVGKSTLLLQVAAMVARAACAEDGGGGGGGGAAPPPAAFRGRPVLYVTAEESKHQVHDRALRLGLLGGDSGGGGDEGAASTGNDNGGSGSKVAGSPSQPQPQSQPPPAVLLHAESSLDAVLAEVACLWPAAVVVDSIQTVVLDGVEGRAGSVLQVRECATALVGVAKALGIAVFLVGHVTKSRELAGPKSLEHLVDAVVYLEGERGGELRLLRAVKNRFGRVGEVGLFVMSRGGLEAAPSPELLFTSGGGDGSGEDGLADAGAAVGVVVEGARPLLVEVQALVVQRGAGGGAAAGGGMAQTPLSADDDGDTGGGAGSDGEDSYDEFSGGGGGGWGGGGGGWGMRGGRRPGGYGAPGAPPPMMTRSFTGFRDRGRVSMLLEVLGKHTNIKTGGAQSVHVNVVGGYRVDASETGLDLPLLAAVASSYLDAPLPPRTLLVGEVGLRGELRRAPNTELRLLEAAKLGYAAAIVPAASRVSLSPAELNGMRLVHARSLAQALEAAFGPGVVVPAGRHARPSSSSRGRRGGGRSSRATPLGSGGVGDVEGDYASGSSTR